MDVPIGVALIGCGWAGERHARVYDRCGARLRWCVDTVPSRAEALAQGRPDVQVSTQFHDALRDPAAAAVDVCLPHCLHAPVAIEAAQAGKHILVEKPLAHSLEAADRMIAAAQKADVLLMVAENEHFNPLYHRMRELIADGVVGEPALVQMKRECYLNRSFLEDRPWFLDAEAAAGGIMMSGGIHDVDILRLVVGEIESIQALRAHQRFAQMEGDDTSVALIRFCSGAVGTLVESFCMKSLATASGREIHTLRVDGDLGHISAHDGRTIRVFSERSDYLVDGCPAEHVLYVRPQDTFRLEIEHFVNCIRSRSEPVTSGRAQREGLRIVLEAYQSMG
jgi:predicted dehydrogenase